MTGAIHVLRDAARWCPVHHMPDCSPLLNGCNLPNRQAAALADLDVLVQAARVVVEEHAADNPFVGYSVEALALHLSRVRGDAA